MWNFALPESEVGEHLVARLAEILGDAVDQLRVADLVLHLRGQRELPLQRRRLEDPFALGQHAHQLAVGVHLDELDQPLPVLVRQPVGRLDLAALLDVGEEFLRARIQFEPPYLPIVRLGTIDVREARQS